MRPARSLALVTASLALGGCIAVENSRLEIGDDLLLPALRSAPPTVATADEPSLVAIDRTNWAVTTFRVPADAVQTSPPYRPLITYPKVTARQRGEFPTMLTALDGADERPSRQTGVGLVSSLRALIDAALLLPRMIFVREPFYTIESPRGDYQRWRPTPAGAVHAAMEAAPEEGVTEDATPDQDGPP